MKKVDVIGIGAINIDYIFAGTQSDNKEDKKKLDDGEEIFVKEHVFREHFEKVRMNSKLVNIEVGGSSLLAIRTLKSMCSQLTTAYVGVYGRLPRFMEDTRVPESPNHLRESLKEYVDEDSWLFYDENSDTGSAIVKLYKRKRQFINILPGANNQLKERIERAGKDQFVSFLSSAKWIHMTSLRDVHQFVVISEYVKEAKAKNPSLIVSLDPGYDYTKNHWKTLKSILPMIDFLFLSKGEYANLTQNIGLPSKSKATVLGNELNAIKANPQIIIIKGKNKVLLLSLINNKAYTRIYRHKRIPYFRILNDTGAGDAFAGGFIVGKLSPELLSHQPAPIKLASIAASTRLQSIEWPTKLKQNAIDYITKNMRDESLNYKQIIGIISYILKKPLLDFFVGVLVGVLGNWIWHIITH